MSEGVPSVYSAAQPSPHPLLRSCPTPVFDSDPRHPEALSRCVKSGLDHRHSWDLAIA